MDRSLKPDEVPMPIPELIRSSAPGALVYLGRGLALTGRAVIEALSVIWAALCVTLLVVGIGVLLVPGAFDLLRSNAHQQRVLAKRWSGVTVAEAYRSTGTAAQEPGVASAWRRTYVMLGDRATWQDVRWHLFNPFVGVAIAFAPAALIIYGLWGVVLLWLWDVVTTAGGTSWYLFVPLNGTGSAVLAAAFGIVLIVVGLVLARPMVRTHGRWVRAMLSTESRDGLEHRVAHLSQSRSDVVDHESRELRRIERDLHDGAQARLVAMGMTLTAAERLIDENPESARAMVNEAKATSAAALIELRELVRGIHPPVLADRGLVDAVRARALESPLRISVGSNIEGRPLPPLESAVYFAVSELLANVAKHAAAATVKIEITYDEGTLRVTVQDDGPGGADPEGGTGLRGIERRLAAFDGDLLVHSPHGGPTTASIVVPCDLYPEEQFE